MPNCVPFLGVGFVLTIFICPIVFGALIAGLKEDIAILKSIPVTMGISTRFPLEIMTCMTWPSSVSKRVSNVITREVSGNRTVAANFSSEYYATKPKGTKGCMCSRSSMITFEASNGTMRIINKETDIDCGAASEWVQRNTTAYIYWTSNETFVIDYESPQHKEQEFQDDIGGYYVGIFLCCGFIAFLITGAVLHCVCSRRSEKIQDYSIQNSIV
jgi:hypothetical protein